MRPSKLKKLKSPYQKSDPRWVADRAMRIREMEQTERNRLMRLGIEGPYEVQGEPEPVAAAHEPVAPPATEPEPVVEAAKPAPKRRQPIMPKSP